MLDHGRNLVPGAPLAPQEQFIMSGHVVRAGQKGVKRTLPPFGDTSVECDVQLCGMGKCHYDRKPVGENISQGTRTFIFVNHSENMFRDHHQKKTIGSWDSEDCYVLMRVSWGLAPATRVLMSVPVFLRNGNEERMPES